MSKDHKFPDDLRLACLTCALDDINGALWGHVGHELVLLMKHDKAGHE